MTNLQHIDSSKYISFIIGIIWSYSIIKTQSVFSKKAGFIFKVLISKVSWLTFIAACYFGYKNFSMYFSEGREEDARLAVLSELHAVKAVNLSAHE